MVPGYLSELVPPTTEQRHNYVMRRLDNVTPFRTHRQYFSSSFYPSVVQEWNQLPSAIQNSHSLDTFCRALKGHIKSTLKGFMYSADADGSGRTRTDADICIKLYFFFIIFFLGIH